MALRLRAVASALVLSSCFICVRSAAKPSAFPFPEDVEDETKWTRVWAVDGQMAGLPCAPNPLLEGDSPTLVLWYKGNTSTPVYSYDARASGGFNDGDRWADLNVLGPGAYFVPYPDQQVLPNSRNGRSLPQETQNYVLGEDGEPHKRVLLVKRRSKKKKDSLGGWEEDGPSYGRPMRWVRVNNRHIPKQQKPLALKWRLVNLQNQKEVSKSRRQIYKKVSKEREVKGEVLSRSSRDIGTSDPVLVLNPVSQQDHGLYRCRMDYNKSPTTMSYTGLYVAIPPDETSILWEGRLLNPNKDGDIWVGPIEEGSSIHLSCKVKGGRPHPTVTWWKGESKITSVRTSTHSNSNFRNAQARRRMRFRRLTEPEDYDFDDTLLNDVHNGEDSYRRISKRESRRNGAYNRWWDAIKEPNDPDDYSHFNYSNFLGENVKYTDQYADQFGFSSPPKTTKKKKKQTYMPTAEPVQLKPKPQADIINSMTYAKERIVQSDVTVTASRDMLGVTLYCKSEQTDSTPKNLLKPKTVAVKINITLDILQVEIEGGEQPVSAGSDVRMVCRAWGSNPPAEITWWKAGTPMPSSVSAVMEGGNMTTVSIFFKVSHKDDDSTLSCKATNLALRSSAKTKSRRITVFYPPEVELKVSSPPNTDTVVEDSNVVMVCYAHSNPPPHKFNFYLDNVELFHQSKGEVSVTDSTLTIHKIKRGRSGAYSCKATNIEGETMSKSIHLTVLYAPVCANGWGARTQGAPMGSTESVACRVDAEPSQGLQFSWYKLDSSNRESPLSNKVITRGTTSHVIFTPLSIGDYGTLLCKARNTIGRQLSACRISIVPAGPPDPPINCTAETSASHEPKRINLELDEIIHINETRGSSSESSKNKSHVPMYYPALKTKRETSLGRYRRQAGEDEGPILTVNCLEGFNGGLPQWFLIETWQEGKLKKNSSSKFPEWTITGLDGGTPVTVRIQSANSRGKSHTIRMELHVPDSPKSAAGTDRGIIGVSLIGAGVGIAIGVLLILCGTAVFVMCHRRRKRTNTKPRQSASNGSKMFIGSSGGELQQTEVTLLPPEAYPMVSRCLNRTPLAEPDIVRSQGGGSGENPNFGRGKLSPNGDGGSFAPVVLTPQIRNESFDSDDESDECIYYTTTVSSSSTTTDNSDDVTDLTAYGRQKQALVSMQRNMGGMVVHYGSLPTRKRKEAIAKSHRETRRNFLSNLQVVPEGKGALQHLTGQNMSTGNVEILPKPIKFQKLSPNVRKKVSRRSFDEDFNSEIIDQDNSQNMYSRQDKTNQKVVNSPQIFQRRNSSSNTEVDPLIVVLSSPKISNREIEADLPAKGFSNNEYENIQELDLKKYMPRPQKRPKENQNGTPDQESYRIISKDRWRKLLALQKQYHEQINAMYSGMQSGSEEDVTDGNIQSLGEDSSSFPTPVSPNIPKFPVAVDEAILSEQKLGECILSSSNIEEKCAINDAEGANSGGDATEKEGECTPSEEVNCAKVTPPCHQSYSPEVRGGKMYEERSTDQRLRIPEKTKGKSTVSADESADQIERCAPHTDKLESITSYNDSEGILSPSRENIFRSVDPNVLKKNRANNFNWHSPNKSMTAPHSEEKDSNNSQSPEDVNLLSKFPEVKKRHVKNTDDITSGEEKRRNTISDINTENFSEPQTNEKKHLNEPTNRTLSSAFKPDSESKLDFDDIDSQDDFGVGDFMLDSLSVVPTEDFRYSLILERQQM